MTNEESDSLDDAIEGRIRMLLYNEVSTFFPGRIKTVKVSPHNPSTTIVDVESAFLRVEPETNTTKPRQIQSVPLILPGRTNTFMIRPPMDDSSLVGAYVGLIISNSYLANWKKTGGSVLPTDGRKYHHADAVAILGLYPDLEAWTTAPKENTAQIKVKPGTYLEAGSSEVDIMRLLSDILNILQTATTLVAGAPVPLTFIPSTLPPLKTIAQLTTDLAKITNPDFNP